MAAKEHPEVIEGRRRLIDVDVPDSEESAEDASIVHDDADEIEEDGSGLVGGNSYRRGARYAEGFEVFLSFVLHIETFFFTHRRSYSNTCVILGHGQSGGRGEVLSVLILMLRPPKINAVS